MPVVHRGILYLELDTNCHNPGCRLFQWLGLPAVVLLISTSLLLAHSEPPPKPPPPPIPPNPATEAYALRWSWVHWWEANRDLYLRPATQASHEQDVDPTVLAAIRADASVKLIEALQDPQVEPRLAAALALGRIGAPTTPGVHEALEHVAEKDESELARCYAILAIGMIGDESSETFLSTYKPNTQRLRSTMLLACGYLTSPSDKMQNRLRVFLNDATPMARYAALWALAHQRGGLTEKACLGLMQRDVSPWIVSDAILAAGPLAGDDGARALCAVVSGDQAVNAWPGCRELETIRKAEAMGLTIEAYRYWAGVYRRFMALSPTPQGALPQKMRLDGSAPATDTVDADSPLRQKWLVEFRGLRMVRGISDIYKARLRSSAAIALGAAGDQPGATDALLKLLHERDNGYNLQPKCFALISLGQSGDKSALDDMLLALSNNDERGHRKSQELLSSPLRGFAAIGLGLYARPYATSQGSTDRPEYQRAIDLLLERLLDDREQLEVRSACAVALGLTGRSANLKPLITNYDALDEANPLLGGYVLLSRALLGDRNLIEPIRAAMARKPQRDETTDLLTRRAAVLSLGVSGTSEAIPVLIGYWDEPYFVSREVILALSLCGVEGLTGRILPGVTGNGNQYERAYYAQIVGRTLERHHPPAVSRLLIGGNYQMWNGLILPFQRQSNRFLYDYLIPQFKDPWY